MHSSTLQVLVWFAGAVLGGILGVGITGFAGLAEAALTPCLIALLFLTFLELPFDSGLRALRDRRFLALVAGMNFVVVPAVVAGLIAVFDIADPIVPAVLIVLLCPCIDYVIAFTRAAGGAARSPPAWSGRANLSVTASATTAVEAMDRTGSNRLQPCE